MKDSDDEVGTHRRRVQGMWLGTPGIVIKPGGSSLATCTLIHGLPLEGVVRVGGFGVQSNVCPMYMNGGKKTRGIPRVFRLSLRPSGARLVAASVVPWSTWLAGHPDTTVLATGLDNNRPGAVKGHDDFVIGVALSDSATAYGYGLASDRRVIADSIGDSGLACLIFPNPPFDSLRRWV